MDVSLARIDRGALDADAEARVNMGFGLQTQIHVRHKLGFDTCIDTLMTLYCNDGDG